MSFISFTAGSTKTLDSKVNNFLTFNHGLEVIKMEFTSNENGLYVAILYRQ